MREERWSLEEALQGQLAASVGAEEVPEDHPDVVQEFLSEDFQANLPEIVQVFLSEAIQRDIPEQPQFIAVMQTDAERWGRVFRRCYSCLATGHEWKD